jgi:hypothetical protein
VENTKFPENLVFAVITVIAVDANGDGTGSAADSCCYNSTGGGGGKEVGGEQGNELNKFGFNI